MKTLMRIPGPRRPAGPLAKGLRWIATLLALLVAVLGVFALFASGKDYPITNPGKPGAQLRGAYHVHSKASDGRADYAELAGAARRAGLAFVVLTDHNLEALPAPHYLDGVLMVPGVEQSTPWGHLVALGSSRPLTRDERKHDPIGAVRRLGGLAVLAHPVQPRNPWKDWDAGTRADGFELFSGDTMLREVLRSPGRLVCAAGSYLSNPMHGLMVLVLPQPEAGARLVGLPAPKVALCALDAHGLPSYETEFRMLSTYLPAEVTHLPEDPLEAARLVLQAIGEGRSYCAFDALGGAAGFSIEGKSGPREATVGERLKLVLPPTGEARVRVTVSGGASVDLDAGTVLLERAGTLQLGVELLAPGCTFGEEWRPWIVPSPLTVRAADGGT
ncbi:MAG: CehA/McbA family metallohydrolase domain-containing protein [Myxococcaceae bacterium]